MKDLFEERASSLKGFDNFVRRSIDKGGHYAILNISVGSYSAKRISILLDTFPNYHNVNIALFMRFPPGY